MNSFSTKTFTITLFLVILHLVRAEDNHKRAPSGFIGVRGKKSIPDDPNATVNKVDDEEVKDASDPASESRFFENDDLQMSKRAPSMGFVGMRGKKPWGRNLYYETTNDRMPKRAPNGFFGMRGKKNLQEDYPFELEKRVNHGFFGMRGKKDDFSDEFSSFVSDSRVPSSNYLEVENDRNIYDGLSDLNKRAPSGFFGMRGKKQWSTFALRGKKIPYQFRGKFVGVRGKKNSDGNTEMAQNYDSDMSRLLNQLLEDEDYQRGSSGTDAA